MSTYHAVVWIDHQSAQVLQFDEAHVEAQRVKAHSHHSRQHGNDEHLARQFYAQVAQALHGVHEVLLAGPGAARNELRKYCDEQAPAVGRAIVDSVATDHPSEAQLVALARKYFLRHDRMAGTPTPT